MPRAQKLFAAYAPNLAIQPYGIKRPHIPTKFYLREYIKSLMSRLEFLLK